MEDLLTTFGFQDLIEKFKDEDISDEETLKLLTNDSLKEIIPKVGTRLRFLKKLREHFEVQGQDATTVNLTPERQAYKESSSDSASLTVINSPNQGCTCCENINVRAILTDAGRGDILVIIDEDPDNLSFKDRNLINRILVDDLLNRHGTWPHSSHKLSLAKAIVKEFPQLRWTVEQWYLKGSASSPAVGWLEERIKNKRKIDKKHDKLETPKRPKPKDENPRYPESDLTDDECELKRNWLKYNSEPRGKILEVLEQTAKFRLKYIHHNKDMSIARINDLWPRIFDIKGALQQDFLLMYGEETASKLLSSFETKFVEKLIMLSQLNIPEKAKAYQVENDSEDGKLMTSLLLLPYLLPTKGYRLSKKFIKPSHSDSELSFMAVLPAGSDLEFYHHTSTREPHVLLIGEKQKPSQIFVSLETASIECTSVLEAVDIAFKAYYVIDINYPPKSKTVWEFFQHVVFDMPLTSPSPTLTELKSKFF